MNELARLLEREGYECVVSPFRSFDTVVRKKKDLIIVKYVRNLDGLKQEQANEIKRVSSVLNTDAVIISECTKRSNLQPNVVYRRYSLPGITLDTFLEYLNGKIPEAEYNRGRVIYTPKNLKEAREKKGLNRKELAEFLGVSYESIYYYENKGMNVREEVFKKMQEVLEINAENKLFPGEPCIPDAPESDVDEKLINLNFYLFKITKKREFASDTDNMIVVNIGKKDETLEEFTDFVDVFLLYIGRSGLIKRDLKNIRSKEELLEKIKR